MSRRYQDPWGDYRRDRDDLSMAAAFFMTFALLALVAWVIFFGTGWMVPAALDAIPSRATRTPAAYTTSTVPASGISFPLVAANPTKPATTGTTAATTSSSTTAEATPTPTSAAGPTKLRIGNTGGDGVYLRRTPNEADTWIPWPDNTVLEYLNQDQQNGGTLFKKVRDPRGNVGWMPAQYLVPVQ